MPTMAELLAAGKAAVGVKPAVVTPRLPPTPSPLNSGAHARATEGSKAAVKEKVHTTGAPVAMAGKYPHSLDDMPTTDELNERALGE